MVQVRHICVVITARPSYSRVYTVLKALKARQDIELFIMATASAKLRRYGRVFDQIAVDFPLNWMEGPSTVVQGDTSEEAVVSTGLLTIQLGNHLAMMKPDMVVTIADRHETLATAIAASYQNIPLCHIQGGEMSGSIDDKVRNAVTQLADIHCVATETAYRRLLRRILHFEPDMKEVAVGPFQAWQQEQIIHHTGCPGIDLAAEAKRLGPLPGKDIVVLQHPDTTEVNRDAAEQIRPTIEAIRPYADRALWFWPGEDAGTDTISKALRMAGLHPVRNLPPVEFLRTLLGSGVLVGNSSVGIRECSYLGIPVVNVGDRQRGRERGINVSDAPYDATEIRNMVKARLAVPANELRRECLGSTLYGDGHAGERIAAILAGEPVEAVA